MAHNLQIVGLEMGRWNDERSELQTEWHEVFDLRQVLGDGTEGGRVRVGSAREGAEAEVEPGAAGGEEGDVNGQDARSPSWEAPTGQDARRPSETTPKSWGNCGIMTCIRSGNESA